VRRSLAEHLTDHQHENRALPIIAGTQLVGSGALHRGPPRCRAGIMDVHDGDRCFERP
jgi:hypothetical protein